MQTDQYTWHVSTAPSTSAAHLVEYENWKAADADPAVPADRASRTMVGERG